MVSCDHEGPFIPVAAATEQGDDPKWEHVFAGEMWRVRWSELIEGEYLWVRHYPADSWGENAAARNAALLNEQRRAPWEWPAYREVRYA